MKKLALFFLPFLFSTSHATKIIQESYNSLTGDTSYLLENPTHPDSKLYFSIWDSKEGNGICKAIGFEKAALGSHRNGDKYDITIRVDESGNVVSAPTASAVSKIVCLNKTGVFPRLKSYLITNPMHTQSNLYFSIWDNKEGNGICKAMGFEKAAFGSHRSGNKYDITIRVDENGNVFSAPTGHIVSKIVCLK